MKGEKDQSQIIIETDGYLTSEVEQNNYNGLGHAALVIYSGPEYTNEAYRCIGVSLGFATDLRADFMGRLCHDDMWLIMVMHMDERLDGTILIGYHNDGL